MCFYWKLFVKIITKAKLIKKEKKVKNHFVSNMEGYFNNIGVMCHISGTENSSSTNFNILNIFFI